MANKFRKTKVNAKININRIHSTPKHGYYDFGLYFSDREPEIGAILRNCIAFRQYVNDNIELFPMAEIERKESFTVDVAHLRTDQKFSTAWSTFSMEVTENPKQSLACLGLAMHQSIIETFQRRYIDFEGPEPILISHLPKVYARLVNHAPMLQIIDLKVTYLNKLVIFRGTVVNVSNSHLLCTQMEFQCCSCDEKQVIEQNEGLYTVPPGCTRTGCKVRSNFIPQFSSSETKTIDCQILKLHELIGIDQSDYGKVTRMIECELQADLVNTCTPGDDVVVTGIFKMRNTESRSNESSVFQTYIAANSVVNIKSQASLGSTSIEFTTADYYAIRKIHSQPLLFRYLVQSLCPNIYRHEMVKASLLLTLFGGTRNDNSRANPHILIVGDPGLGKSQMLQACTSVAPRGIYICGNTSTNSGLTVTMTKGSSGEYMLEAGALVLTDQGTCCIDEFDKMSTQYACLLEAMEQQSISIAKAGVNCSLPTRTTIIAAANPAGGHYNRTKTVSENLKLGAPLLSRFDLIFIMLDQSDKVVDSLLSKHVLAMHSALNLKESQPSSSGEPALSGLQQILLLQPGETIDHLPHELFRKYIAYARKYVHPKLNEAAQDILTEFYLALRQQSKVGGSTPVTPRQLESLIRLTQARAKVELREEATAEDAKDVMELMRHSLLDVFSDESGQLDFGRSQNGTGMSRPKQAKHILKMLQRKAELESRSVFTVHEIREIASEIGLSSQKCHEMIESLNVQNYLLKKGGDRYQLMTVDF